MMFNQGADLVIADYIGRGSFNFFRTRGMEVYWAKNISLRDAVDKYLSNKLILLKDFNGVGRKDYGFNNGSC